MHSNNSAPLNAATVLRGGPIRWLILGGALLITAIAVGATIMAGNFRERALLNAERELENTVLLLARHFDQQLGVREEVFPDQALHLLDLIRSERLGHCGRRNDQGEEEQRKPERTKVHQDLSRPLAASA